MGPIIDWVGVSLEVAGVAAISVGALYAVVCLVRQLVDGRTARVEAYHDFRRALGRSIMIGLEFLVAGDIINTVAVTPTFQKLGVLAGIVLIRTFVSFTLEVEMKGRWPWQGGGD
ncbi:MAG: DUF1622 domain-containing protein [Chitinivibrionales bacterium]|nr:DUF1622 domain-containing protein [Chitinivibrionales bacterium]